MGKYLKVQQDAIKRYNIILCYGKYCKNDWHRTHVHIKQRIICKWFPKNSIQSTFTLLHEIGHIMTNKSAYRRCEQEYYATEWALKEAREYYGLEIPERIVKLYNAYVKLEYNRGIRRRGKLPPYESLILR